MSTFGEFMISEAVKKDAEQARLRERVKTLENALRELFNMVNYALDARDVLLISKTCATMDAAREALACTSEKEK